MTSAVVFAYHNVGVRCLSVLLDRGVHVSLLLTHENNPGENVWFESVAELAALHGLPVITPDDPNAAAVVARIAALEPDFLFSFYYRLMLKPPLLAAPSRGAFNVHGSLLPRYRGRAPVNWAIIKGETETGATLHVMQEKPDTGAIVDQQAVPILENDTALDVFNKVTVAAETVLYHALPRLIDGAATLTPQDLRQGGYFGGRKPEDGVINWRNRAADIHNLVRAVAPPYPGASTVISGRPARLLRTLWQRQRAARGPSPSVYVEDGSLFVDCGDNGVLQVLTLEIDGKIITAQDFRQRFGAAVQLV